MSSASKATLAVATVVSVSIIGYVHYRQTIDREKMHEGVVQDLYRQQLRKTENLYLLQQQKKLTKQLQQETE